MLFRSLCHLLSCCGMLRWILWAWNRYISAASVYRGSEDERGKSFRYDEAYQSLFQRGSSCGVSFKWKNHDHSWNRRFCIFHCRTLYRSRYGHEKRKPDHPADYPYSPCTAFYKDHIRSIKKLSFVFRFSLYDQEIQMGVFYWISEVPCIVANICRINFIRHCRNHRHYHRLLLFPFHCHRNYCLHQRPLRFRCPDRQKYPLSYLQGQEMR